MFWKVIVYKLRVFFGVVATMTLNLKKHYVRMWKYPRSKRNKFILFFTSLLTFWLGLRILNLFVCDYSLVLISSEHNYLKGIQDPSFSNGNFLIDNSKCRIPDIKFWNEEVRSIVNREVIRRCEDVVHLPNIEDLISVIGQTLHLNEDALMPLELTLEDIECCYQVVERVNQDDQNYNMNADNSYRYSDMCYPMGLETTPHASLLKITCHQKNFLGRFKKKIHVDFHLVAMFPPVDSQTELGKKLAFWKERALRSTDHTLTSVLIIVVDSTSRLSFHRMMPSTVKTLEDKLNAVEMNGYMKAGLNTLPSALSWLTSYSVDEIIQLCHQSPETPFDSCPFLWKNFTDINFLNAFIEDRPKIGVFNYYKLGFVKQPTDFYVRPWMLAAYNNNEDGCIGYRRTEQVEINYTRDLVELAFSKGIPYFATLWLSERNHEAFSEVMHMDEPISEALLHMKITGSLENTVVIVMADHGTRFLDIRRTLSGWFEDKLPGLWISLPENLVKTYPSWKTALHHNSRQLVTPYNIYFTLSDIVKHNSHQLGITTSEESTSTDGRGGSLLENLPERSCDEAGVPWEFCACASPIEYKGNNHAILMASQHVVNEMNQNFHLGYGTCGRIHRYNVIAMAIVPKLPLQSRHTSSIGDYSRNTYMQSDLFEGKSLLVIGLAMGDEAYYTESVLKYNQTTLQFDVVANHQTNQMYRCNVWTILHRLYCG